MLKKGLTLLLAIMITVSLSPFSIYADTSVNTSPFIGVNIQITGYGENQTSITFPSLNINEISSNQSYAYIHGQLNCTSPSTPTSSSPCDIYTYQNSNGNTSVGTQIDLNLQNYLLKFNGNATINGINYFFVDYEFILDGEYKGSVTVTDENDVTKTIYVNGSSFHYQRMQDDLTQHTFTITDYSLIHSRKNIMWNFPIESWAIIARFMDSYNEDNDVYTLLDYPVIGNWTFPLFKITESSFDLFGPLVVYPESYADYVAQRDYLSHDAVFIFMTNIASATQSYWNFTFEGSGVTLKSADRLFFASIRNPDTNVIETWSCIKLVFNGTSAVNMKLRTTTTPYYVIPIYKGYGGNVSTDFALQFGLSNEMLDNLDLLANGNTASNNAVSNNDTTNSQLQTDSNTLFQQENTFKQDMNNAMSNIDTSFSVNNFGSKFLSSASWVRTQYERMTNNTPFQYVITFSLMVGLAMILIGKVRK